MKAQEIFDTVAAHLRQQNSKALMSDELRQTLRMGPGTCVYRNSEGKKCAVGCLLLEDEYQSDMEGQAIGFIIGHTKYNASLMRLSPHIKLIKEFQSLHDNYDVEDWEEGLQDIADVFKLTYTPKGTC